MGKRGRKPASVMAVEKMAVDLWAMAANEKENQAFKKMWARVAAELFGAGVYLRCVGGDDEARRLSLWLSSLASHISYGDLPIPSQSDFVEAGSGTA